MANYYGQNPVAQRQEDSQSQYQQLVEDSFGIRHHQHGHGLQPVRQQHESQASQQLLQRQQQTYPLDSRQLGHVPEQYPNSRCRLTSSLHEIDAAPRSERQHNLGARTVHSSSSTSYHLQSNANPYAGYYSHPATGTNTPEPSVGQPASYPQTPLPFYQQDMQHDVRLPPVQAHVSQHFHSRLRSERQTHHTPLSLDAESYASEFLVALHSNPQSSQSSSSSVPSPWSDEVYPTGSRGAESSAGLKNPGLHLPDPDMRLPSASKAVYDNTPKAISKRKHTDSGGQQRKMHRSQGKDGGSGKEASAPPADAMDVASGAQGRMPGACIHCKKVKMKCEFQEGENTCERCKSHGRTCTVEGRKPKPPTNRRDYLLAQIKQKDAIIETLLKQLHDPYNTEPMSIASYRAGTSPSDQNNMNLLDWLSRVQSNMDTVGGGWPGAFRDTRESVTGVDDDSDIEEPDNQRLGSASSLEDEDNSSRPTDKLSSLLDLRTPLGMIANLSLSNIDGKGKGKAQDPSNREDSSIGVANNGYFKPGPATDLDVRTAMIEQYSLPEIILHGLVTPEDVDRLFDIFYERINPFVSLLDPILHTPDSTFARSPLLYNVICAVSSRYDIYKSEFHPVAMRFAKNSAANALIDGWKSIELCQAYILMSMYAVPTQRWEEDRSWLYTGLAIRIATDLNLHQIPTAKPQDEKQEREMLNRIRVWLICCNLDLSTATQFGKPSIIKDNYIMRNATHWYKETKYNSPYDIHLCAHSELLRIGAGFNDQLFSDPSVPSGLNERVDLLPVIMNHDNHLTTYLDEWLGRFAEYSDINDSGYVFRCSLLPYLVGYSRLVMFSFGFQQAYERGIKSADSVYFTKIMEASKYVIRMMIEELAPSGYMRYAPDEYFMIASFASVSFIKLLRPEISSFFSKEQEVEMFNLIEHLVRVLCSREISVDDRHIPKLYGRFLADILSRHPSSNSNADTAGRLHHHSHPGDVLSAQGISQMPVGQGYTSGPFGHATDIYQPGGGTSFPASAGTTGFGPETGHHRWGASGSQGKHYP